MIKPATLQFLKDLESNNNKPWFDTNKNLYLAARADFENFVIALLQKMVVFDPSLKELQAKDCMFRINRDVRFSKNKTPYKINLSASFSKGGKKSVYADYYFHLQPGGKSYTGGGIWMPEAAEMKKIRQEIDYNFPEFNKIIQAAAFKKTFGELERMEGQMLVNVPKGYEKDNPAAHYLKLKSWVATHSFTDESLMKSAIVNETAQILRTLQPMIAFLNRSLD